MRPASRPPVEPTHLRGLDGLRCLSVLFVVLTHSGALGSYGHVVGGDVGGARVASLVHGITGVSAFFVISGFLITTLLLRERARNAKIDLAAFYARRLLRIVPCYVVYLGALFVLARAAVLVISDQALWYAALYATNFVPRLHYYGELGHTWSLAVEEHFYLFWPLALVWLRGRALVIGLLGMIGLCSWLYGGFVYTTPLRASYFTEYWTLPAALGIFVGCLLACVREDEGLAQWARRTLAGRQTWFVMALLYGAPLWLPQALLHSVLLFQDVGIALFIFALLERPSSRLVAALETAPLPYLGKISYGIYVWQGLFLRTGPGGELWIQAAPQNLVLTLGAAVLSYHALERPFLRLKSKFSR